MTDDPLMSRLCDANPERLTNVRDDELKERILSITPAWRTSQRDGAAADSTGSVRRGWWRGVTLRSGSSNRVRGWSAAGAVAAAVLAVLLAVSLSGSAPTVAQAFPVLNGPSVITPTELQRSLVVYGVSGNAGLEIGRGRPVSTPWGVGYVLTNQPGTVVCLVAPGLNQHDWGAACGQERIAAARGTYASAFAYDAASDTARYLQLLPRNATVTVQTPAGAPHKLTLHDGVLAISITKPVVIDVTIDGHTTSAQISPQDAMTACSLGEGSPRPAYCSPAPSTGSSTSTTTTATSTARTAG